jgi:endoglucanase
MPNLTYNATASTSAPSSIANSTYASMLLSHAQTLYSTANTSDFATFSESIPAVASAYSSSGYGDDLALAALSLALATNSSQYYADAYHWYEKYSLSGSQGVWNWDSRAPAIYVLFVEVANARPGLASGAGLGVNLTGWQFEAEGWFDRIINGSLENAYVTSGMSSIEGVGKVVLNKISRTALLGWRFGRSLAQPSSGRCYAHVQIRPDGFKQRQSCAVQRE